MGVLTLAVTRISVRWPIPRVTTFVVYGVMGTKSLAITVKVWPSMLNLWSPSAPALIRRSRCVLPDVNLNWASPAFLVHFVVSPLATVLQSKLPLPLIRLLSDGGAIWRSDPLLIRPSTMVM